MTEIITRRLACGMDLIVENLPGMRSAGVCWLVSGGSAREPEDKLGLGAMWTELLYRGAGDLDSRAHADALDRLGVSRGADVQTYFLKLGATLLGENMGDALPLIVDMVRRPRMEADAIEPVRDLCVQSIEALADDPHQRVMLLAREKHAPPPLNRSGMGTIPTLESLGRDDLLHWWSALAAPRGSILAVAGDADPDRIAAALDDLLDGWAGAAEEVLAGASAARGHHHQTGETNQVHIAVAHDAPPERSDDALLERIVIGALSGGMSGRLFTEVREKRGLVYAVSATYGASRDFGRVAAYAGTTPERAQETLDVLVGELRRINGPSSSGGGISPSEFERAVVGMKSRLVMSAESSSGRASALATDMFRIGRARTLAELSDAVDAITLDQVNDYLARRELGDLTIATIGPGALDASGVL